MVWVVVWIACGIAGYFIGAAKGRGPLGAVLGGLLGLLGIVIIAVMGPEPEYDSRGSGSGPGMGGRPRATLEERLAKLDQLKASGRIHEAEYQSQRKRLLSEI